MKLAVQKIGIILQWFHKEIVKLVTKKESGNWLNAQKIDFMKKFVKLDVKKQTKYVQSIREKIVKLALQKRVKK